MDVQKYKILYKEGEAEISEKKSRFIAHIAPAQTEEEAMRREYAIKQLTRKEKLKLMEFWSETSAD